MEEPKLDDGQLMFAFAHDLRSYLRTTLTRIQLVQVGGGSALPGQDRQFLEEAAVAAGEMNRLLSAMVSYCDASRVAQKAADRLPLGVLIRGVVSDMKSPLREIDGKVIVETGYDGQAPEVLRTVLRELLANSCRFRSADRRLVIEVKAVPTDGGGAEITVSDNGSGVEPQWTERIFQPFQRIHSRVDFPGFGLGLPLCRKMVVALGGTISANARESGGLSVVVTMPAESL